MMDFDTISKINKKYSIFPIYPYGNMQNLVREIRNRFQDHMILNEFLDYRKEFRKPKLDTITYEDCISIRVDMKEDKIIFELSFYEGDSYNGKRSMYGGVVERQIYETSFIPEIFEKFIHRNIKNLAEELILKEENEKYLKRLNKKIQHIMEN